MQLYWPGRAMGYAEIVGVEGVVNAEAKALDDMPATEGNDTESAGSSSSSMTRNWLPPPIPNNNHQYSHQSGREPSYTTTALPAMKSSPGMQLPLPPMMTSSKIPLPTVRAELYQEATTMAPIVCACTSVFHISFIKWPG